MNILLSHKLKDAHAKCLTVIMHKLQSCFQFKQK